MSSLKLEIYIYTSVVSCYFRPRCRRHDHCVLPLRPHKRVENWITVQGGLLKLAKVEILYLMKVFWSLQCFKITELHFAGRMKLETAGATIKASLRLIRNLQFHELIFFELYPAFSAHEGTLWKNLYFLHLLLIKHVDNK